MAKREKSNIRSITDVNIVDMFKIIAGHIHTHASSCRTPSVVFVDDNVLDAWNNYMANCVKWIENLMENEPSINGNRYLLIGKTIVRWNKNGIISTIDSDGDLKNTSEIERLISKWPSRMDSTIEASTFECDIDNEGATLARNETIIQNLNWVEYICGNKIFRETKKESTLSSYLYDTMTNTPPKPIPLKNVLSFLTKADKILSQADTISDNYFRYEELVKNIRSIFFDRNRINELTNNVKNYASQQAIDMNTAGSYMESCLYGFSDTTSGENQLFGDVRNILSLYPEIIIKQTPNRRSWVRYWYITTPLSQLIANYSTLKSTYESILDLYAFTPTYGQPGSDIMTCARWGERVTTSESNAAIMIPNITPELIKAIKIGLSNTKYDDYTFFNTINEQLKTLYKDTAMPFCSAHDLVVDKNNINIGTVYFNDPIKSETESVDCYVKDVWHRIIIENIKNNGVSDEFIEECLKKNLQLPLNVCGNQNVEKWINDMRSAVTHMKLIITKLQTALLATTNIEFLNWLYARKTFTKEAYESRLAELQQDA